MARSAISDHASSRTTIRLWASSARSWPSSHAATQVMKIPRAGEPNTARMSNTTTGASRLIAAEVCPSNIPARSPSHRRRSSRAQGRPSRASLSTVADTCRALLSVGFSRWCWTAGSVGAPFREASVRARSRHACSDGSRDRRRELARIALRRASWPSRPTRVSRGLSRTGPWGRSSRVGVSNQAARRSYSPLGSMTTARRPNTNWRPGTS